MKRLAPSLLAAALVALAAAGCGSSSGTSQPTILNVYAASSLTGAFTTLGKTFEAQHRHVLVRFDFAGSSDLEAQVEQGAPADVFASADEKNMGKLVAAGLQGQAPKDFASNTLEIVTPPDNPAGVHTFADLAAKGLKLVVCAPEVPCGSAAQAVAASAHVTLHPVSEEQSVKDVLAKVASGEADAGLVYVTDVKAAGSTVTGIPFPEATAAVNVYPITTVKASEQAALARAFVDLVLSDAGRAVLAGAAFAKP